MRQLLQNGTFITNYDSTLSIIDIDLKKQKQSSKTIL